MSTQPSKEKRSPSRTRKQDKPLARGKPEEQLLSPNQAGRLLNVTGECVKQWIYNGKLPATKGSNGYYRIRYADLETYLKSRHDLSSKSVLILCGTEKTTALLRSAIESIGHRALVASDAAEILKSQEVEPGCYIIDVGLPEGWRCLEKLRNRPNVRVAPIVLLSHQALSDAETNKALRLQVQGLLPAPFKAPQVESEMKRVLEGRRI